MPRDCLWTLNRPPCRRPRVHPPERAKLPSARTFIRPFFHMFPISCPSESVSAPLPSKKPTSKAKRPSIASLSEVKGSPVSRVVGKTPSSQRFQTPEGDQDDISVAGSSTSKATRKTEEERIQYFRNQPDCREVEPHRAFCAVCNDWVPLNPSLTYTMRPWTLHRKTCRRGSNTKPLSTSTPSKAADQEDEPVSDDDASVISNKTIRRTEAERQAYLESDPRAEEVRPQEVLCKTCHEWVKLGSRRRYALQRWKVHQQRCSGQIPSSRVATAERKLKLVNDSSAKNLTTKSVDCVHCKKTVALEGEGDYDLTQWEEHKASCLASRSAATPTPRTDDREPKPIAISPRRAEKAAEDSPPSVASTDTTVVDAAGPARAGVKRPREEGDEGAIAEDAPPRVRARTKSTGALASWLIMPIKNFVAGFKEGLQSPTEESPPPKEHT
ncbi:hypothetical protein OF83DRAFT_1150752 [Amylostereum chailletii]|nr:hypothetical protein OF83DRAFT_1150752 [Amylostereum chailletii]